MSNVVNFTEVRTAKIVQKNKDKRHEIRKDIILYLSSKVDELGVDFEDEISAEKARNFIESLTRQIDDIYEDYWTRFNEKAS